ncbi:hypothetical protein HY625_02685 [Candidatus Uhrbacteria bacterium]|nr:hypothetical protein [Candidatus Uhrbacteria bacterium]
MPYVKGTAEVVIHEDGRRQVVTRDLEVVQGYKPRTLESLGSDPETWAKIRAGTPGTYTVTAHFGGATALVVPTRAIAVPGQDFLVPFEANYGVLGLKALIGAVRTGSASATQFCVDTAGGMFTSLDWDYETLAAMLKILVHKSDGWVRIILPEHFAKFQQRFDEEHRQRCAGSLPVLDQRYEARVTFEPVGHDTWNGTPTLVVFGPIGDCQFIRVVAIALEGVGFYFRDGEWTSKELRQPLNRQIVAITTCDGHPGIPLILQLDEYGRIRDGGLHMFVEGPLNRNRLSHNPARVLGPHGLGWLA